MHKVIYRNQYQGFLDVTSLTIFHSLQTLEECSTGLTNVVPVVGVMGPHQYECSEKETDKKNCIKYPTSYSWLLQSILQTFAASCRCWRRLRRITRWYFDSYITNLYI